MHNQLYDFKASNLSFTTKDIVILLSNDSESSYIDCFHKLINSKINRIKHQSNDYKKLYEYWRNNCYSNEYYYKNNIGDRYIDISVDYNLIKNDKVKIEDLNQNANTYLFCICISLILILIQQLFSFLIRIIKRAKMELTINAMILFINLLIGLIPLLDKRKYFFKKSK